VLLRDGGDCRARFTVAEHGDRAAAAAARDLRAVEPCASARLAHQPDKLVRARRTEAAGRVALVRLIHQLAQRCRLFATLPMLQYLRERFDAGMLADRMPCRPPDGIRVGRTD